MNFYFDNDKPIYKQIIDQLKVSIITGVYKCGDKLPSVRDLALSIRVNPNTINRALLELEDENLIVTKRTSGKFITDDVQMIKRVKKELASSIVDKFIVDMKNIDISNKEAIDYIKEREK